MEKIVYRQLDKSDLKEINVLLSEEYNKKILIDKTMFSKVGIGFGCFINNQLVSMGFLSPYHRVPCNDCLMGYIGEMNGIYTLNKFRNNGYSKNVCKHLINYGKELGLDYIHIDTFKYINKMYYSIGFEHQDENEDRLWIKLK